MSQISNCRHSILSVRLPSIVPRLNTCPHTFKPMKLPLQFELPPGPINATTPPHISYHFFDSPSSPPHSRGLCAWPPNSYSNRSTGNLRAHRSFSCPNNCAQVPPVWLNQEFRKTGKFVCTGDVPTEFVSFPSVTSLNPCWHLRHQFLRHIELMLRITPAPHIQDQM